MAVTNMTKTTTGAMYPNEEMKTLLNKTLLMNMRPNLVHLQFGDEYPFPKNNGTVLNMRKILPLAADTTELTEGEPGDAILMNETDVNVEIKQYGRYTYWSDKFDFSHLDMKLVNKVEELGQMGSLSVDAVVRDMLANSTNVIYANGKTSRGALTAADKLTSVELRKAVKVLKKNLAQKFGGYYVAIVGPDTVYDLQDDETFIAVSKYQDKENVYTGEVGRLFGVRLIETTEAKIFQGAGTSGADVASIIVLGRHAYGYTSWTGAKPRVIVHPAGSAGTSDPLDQLSSVGWKVDGFGCAMLQPEFAVRIECGFTAN